MPFANSIILYNAKINHNGLFVCDFGGSGATRDSVMGSSNDLATIKFTYSNMNYMRKDKVIMVDENADVLDNAGVNYCRFINPDFSSSRYIYAFIENIEYVAPSTSRLHIRTDCWMTWFDRIVPNQCFIEREHVANDAPFMNLVPENTPTGALTRIYGIKLLGDSLTPDLNPLDGRWFAVVSVAISGTPPQGFSLDIQDAPIFGGINGGIQYYACDIRNVGTLISYLDLNNVTILGITTIPRNSVHTGTPTVVTITNTSTGISQTVTVYNIRDLQPLDTGYKGDIYIYANRYTANTLTSNMSGNRNTIHIYLDSLVDQTRATYHNVKLLNYPYQAYEFYTYDGSSIELQPELATQSIPNGEGVLVPGLQLTDKINGGATTTETAFLTFTPDSETYADTMPILHLSFNSFPTIACTSDSYSRFVSANANSLKFQKNVALREQDFKTINTAMSSAANAIGGAMTQNWGKVIGSIAGGIEDLSRAGDQIDAINAKMKDAVVAPDGLVGQASDGMLYNLNKLGIYFGFKRMDAKILEIIDNYFDRYGYAVNKLAAPQWNSRPKFNYVKTAGANIAGEIPKADKEVINGLLDTGLTVWHSVGDYGVYDGANNLAPIR